MERLTTPSYLYTNTQYDALRFPSGLQTTVGKVDTDGIIHLAGKDLYTRFPKSAKYNWAVWGGNYNASNLPTRGGIDVDTGLLGRLEGGDPYWGYQVFYISAVGTYEHVENAEDSIFTLAPLVEPLV